MAFRGVNQGETWSRVVGLPDDVIIPPGPSRWDQILAAPGIPGRFYAPSDAGVFTSRDNGLTWARAGNLTESVSVLAIDPDDPQTLYATFYSARGDFEYGLFKTIDGGENWERLSEFPIGALVFDRAMPARLYTFN